MDKIDVSMEMVIIVVFVGFACMVTVGTVYEDCEVVDKKYKNDPLFDDFHLVIICDGEKEIIPVTYEKWLEYEIGDNYSKTDVLPISEWW